jgi:hypothetical protein
VRQKLGLLLGGLAVGVLLARLLRRRRREPPDAPSVQGPDPRAEALRLQLAEDRARLASSQAAGDGEPVSEVDESRRRVHDRGRAAIEEMRGGEPA